MSTELLSHGVVGVLLALQVAHRLALAAAQGEQLSVEEAARRIAGKQQGLATAAAAAYRDITTPCAGARSGSSIHITAWAGGGRDVG
ncbi:hypothetical protein H7J77_11750 [Mycolicibacillus parakoreensis]|uniref:Histidine kinase n=1 Tax=Mycolicibacillus parakoreensis TaxID=1069221 RepID=A0ABY3U483_9MYCO|nr:hypothetical protein [Mycolicibacillus parakoreensis]MCV7316211.1 hypothetical protein [Mycolicibacillus parakoreensis]ULN54796.1 hypothetical protein MIU77_18885 [Mycolicibacillus parakoreensis]